MIVTKTGLIPDLRGEKTIILDFETSSGSKKLMSVNPWHNCRIAGTGITTPQAAEEGMGWYLPSGHTLDDSPDGLQNRDEGQLEELTVARFLWDSLQSADTIVGHNIKYDAHVLCNCLDKYIEGSSFTELLSSKKLLDTLSHSKMVDSDRWSHGLKKLSVDWLGREDHSDPLEPYLKTAGGQTFNKDFGQIPKDICGNYCVEDLITTWEVEKYCRDNMMSCSSHIWEIEQKLTSILFAVERTGMRLDLQRLELMYKAAGQKLIRVQEVIHSLLVKEECSTQYIRPAENEDCFDVICSHYGLPVLEWTDGGKAKNKKPSFSKTALKAYLHHPVVQENENLQHIISLIREFRKWNTINNMFLKPYRELHIDGLLHGDFNQIIRTGRMSMSRPNMQQAPAEVRLLVVPWDQSEDFRREHVVETADGAMKGFTAQGVLSDERLVARDASQIEFRLIVNYCRNIQALQAYQTDPTTDYHQYMATLCHIGRVPAKAINFMLSYGGGKFKCLAMLKDALDLLGNYGAAERARFEGQVLHVPEVTFTPKGSKTKKVIQKAMDLTGFDAFCWTRAQKVYNTYHSRMPELKRTSWKAQEILQSRGYLLNLYGRVRKLPVWQSNKSFNNVIQSSASDIIKERTVALWDRLAADGLLYKGYGDPTGKLKVINFVHDEIVTSEPLQLRKDEVLQQDVMQLLCSPAGMVTNLDVPILWDEKSSGYCWANTK